MVMWWQFESFGPPLKRGNKTERYLASSVLTIWLSVIVSVTGRFCPVLNLLEFQQSAELVP